MDINVHELMSLPAGPRYRLLADRLNACRLWAHEDLFPSVFADAVDRVHAREEQHLNARRFVEHTFINLMARPGGLVELCRRIPAEDLRLAVVEAYVRHPPVAHDVPAAMGASGELYTAVLSPGGDNRPTALGAPRAAAGLWWVQSVVGGGSG
ncbi:hypothetical protein ACIO87_33720 [Streptomyces sp. NPDC087218]|uniref:hypothetical protein n=1 Tax=Streptomyces sp. NPDC087218 TaxID=3365769 RepID=UPI003826737E